MDLPYRLGKYELDKQIGEGATGKVYHAIDTFTDHDVAVKVIDAEVLHDPEFTETCRKQFLSEASLAGQLSHPHVVSILEASVTENFGYVVMEFVPGGNLVPYSYHDSLLPIHDVLEIIYKCCNALEYAFKLGIIHRDIKPGNIMIVSGTNVKITDFGASIFLMDQHDQAVTTGTLSYMSLEHIRGQRLTYLSDMYSLGVVTYELLTGRLPFDADTQDGLIDAIANKAVVSPSKLRREISSKLDKIVLKMMARNPEDRYPSWAVLATEIAGLSRAEYAAPAPVPAPSSVPAEKAEPARLESTAFEISDIEKFSVMLTLEALKNFSDAEIWELVQIGKWLKYPQKKVIIRENEPGNSLYILASGVLKVTRRGSLLNVIKQGEFFGDMAYIQRGTNRLATIETMADCEVIEFGFEALEKLTPGCELHFVESLLLSMTARLAAADERIVRMHG